VADIAIVTALYGGGDVIRAQADQDVDVDWICATDDRELTAPAQWDMRVNRAQFDEPSMAAKWWKLTPWEALEHSWIIWIDANTEITIPWFARNAIASVHDGVAVWRHPRRDCVYAEAEASVGAESQGGKYDGQPIREQAAHYRAEGHPAHGGLFACGTLAWDATDLHARELGRLWLAECERWSYQDQLSLPVVARRLGLSPGVFPHPQIARQRRRMPWLENPWLRIHPHATT
jgi:hypothetical protein